MLLVVLSASSRSHSTTDSNWAFLVFACLVHSMCMCRLRSLSPPLGSSISVIVLFLHQMSVPIEHHSLKLLSRLKLPPTRGNLIQVKRTDELDQCKIDCSHASANDDGHGRHTIMTNAKTIKTHRHTQRHTPSLAQMDTCGPARCDKMSRGAVALEIALSTMKDEVQFADSAADQGH